MIRKIAISWFTGVIALSAADPTDLLRFSNGDQLHGKFAGIQDGARAVWKRDDVEAPVAFKTGELRHIVLRGGQPEKSLTTLSNVVLVNGDRIPGTISGMDEKIITLETPYAGILKVPRDQMAMFAPSPLGGRIHYHGPFTKEDWKMSHASFPEGMPPEKAPETKDGEDAAAPAAEPVDEDDEETPKDDRPEPSRWAFSGSAWYWPGKGYGTALTHDGLMPDRSILRFDIAWKNRLYVAVGFHSDFEKPKAKEEENEGEGNAANKLIRRMNAFVPGDSSIFPRLFGNSYILQLFPTNMMLFRSSADGGPPERLQINGSTYRLGESGKATVEIRSNRINGNISIFVNNEFVAQWNEGGIEAGEKNNYAGKGAGFGFVVPTEDSAVKISDVMIAEWNGMPDSARSLQVDEQDIVLLSNGTDRFSGKIGDYQDGKISMDGKYGRFNFDVADIAEIRFAKDRLAKATEPASDSVVVRMSPMGQISGRALSGNGASLRLATPVCGEIDLNLESAVMLEFEKTENFIDAWDAGF